MFYRPRFPHRLYAWIRGYSWMPCPLCKRRFGRHEWQDGNELWISDRDTVAVCPRCGDEARRINAEEGLATEHGPRPRGAEPAR